MEIGKTYRLKDYEVMVLFFGASQMAPRPQLCLAVPRVRPSRISIMTGDWDVNPLL